MKSSIVDTTNRRKSSISKDEINEAQIGGAGNIFCSLDGVILKLKF